MFHVASINEFAETWWFYVWHAGWQGSLVALLILGVVCGLRRAPSPLRYSLLLVALIKFAMPPMLTASTGLFSHLPAPVVETATPIINTAESVASASTPIAGVAGNESTMLVDPESLGDIPISLEFSSSSLPFVSHALQPVRENLSFNAWLMLIHIVGTGLFGGWLLLMYWRLLRRVARSTLLTEGAVYDQFIQVAQALGVRRPVQLILGEHTAPPMAFGIWHPAVLLPRHFVEDLQGDQLQTVFAHELGHHRRLDLCVNHLQLLILAGWWFNPLVWVLNWILRRVREDCCDDLVLGLELTTHLTYSETLIRVAAQAPARPSIAASLGFAETFHPLTQRVKRIVDSTPPHPVRLSLLGLGLVLLVSGALLPGVHSGHNEVQANQGSAFESELGGAAHESAEASVDRASPEPRSVVEPLAKQGEHTTGHAGVHGQVLFGTDKSFVVGAAVHLLRHGRSWRSAKTVDVETDARGQFVFEDVEPGEYRVWATHDNLVSRQKRYETPIVKVGEHGSIAEPVILHLNESFVLRVRAVSSITNQPLDQAQVHLPWSDIGHYFPADENGLVTIESLTQESWHYEVTAPGHGRVVRVAKLQRPLENIFDVRLPAGGTLSGVVTDQNNQGIEGVGVHLYPTGDGHPFAEVKTDQDGAYQFPHVPIDMSVGVRYHCKNFLSASKRKIVLTEPDQVRTLNVQLKKPPLGGSVIGVVMNQHNQPIRNARAVFHTGSSSDIRKVTSDESGRFRMDDIPDRPGNMLLTIRAKGYAPKNIEIRPGTQRAPQDLSIRLAPGHTIAGKVVDEAGQAIPGVWIFAGRNRFPNRMGGNTHSDQDGRFAFDSLPSSIQFDFQAQGYSSIRNHNLAIDHDDHVIVMVEHGIIAGQIVDAETGAPIPFFTMKVRRSGNDYQDDLPSSLSQGVDINSEMGRFHLEKPYGCILQRCNLIESAFSLHDLMVSHMSQTTS